MYKLILATVLVAVAISPEAAYSQNAGSATYSQQLKQEEQRRAQEDEALRASIAERDSKFGILPDNAPPEIKTSYTQRVEAFRKSIQEVRRNFSRYHMTSKDFDEDVKRIGLWDKALGAANENAQAWLDEMIAIYQSDPVRYNGVGLTLMEIVRREGQLDRVEDVHQAARVILDTPPAPLDPPLIDAIGYIGYASCDFDLAQKAWTKYSQDAVLPEASNSKFQTIDLAKQQWELEQQYRKDDAGKDNPIVQLITTKGTLTVELFEDQAPNSVANFIYLIEHDYYSRLRIFKVLEKFGIQTGCKLGDGSSNAGYTIPSEAALADSRKVFRGSLFYAIGASKDTNALDPSTASSQFVIATTPLPTLNDQVTVFGRVIDGEFKLGTFRKVDLTKEEQKKDPNIETDYLARSTITKKRDHQYLPEILEGKLPY